METFTEVLDRLAGGRYVSLTTYRKDGRPVPTPVGFAVDAGELLLLTPADTGKVKRIRNNSRVVIAPCDSAGRVPNGAPSAEGTASLLTGPDAARAHRLLARKYFPLRVIHLFDRIVRRRRVLVGIAVRDQAAVRPQAGPAPEGPAPKSR
ncbi:PPOX class F420-dependent oxidoreductase [Actinacidiphila acididurans]|uniref:PPOX class F420-dependent oxidoreductase n=1 Tax=Actinacidiphila acididurans TaxID=2784346 RepID=A0ABS2TL64_9ACTN|nr:PPOX class F420-dependent oxidoreductase [Actinacidiphila acididurans]MBM9504079.1 PPOX class F420-dependent oxidoreductase [Actinacidiphila acididurans]